MHRIPPLLLLVGSLLALAGCTGPPQIGTDRATFKAVDALYTAVSLRDSKLVERCAADLKALEGAGKAPRAVVASLDAIIAEANGGRWQPALDRLAAFMEGQRR
jgi:hypothetical protein